LWKPECRSRRSNLHEGRRPRPFITSDLVVEEVLDALGSCPSFVPGQNNRELLAALGGLPRVQQVEAMAAAHAGFAKRRQ